MGNLQEGRNNMEAKITAKIDEGNVAIVEKIDEGNANLVALQMVRNGRSPDHAFQSFTNMEKSKLRREKKQEKN